MMDRRFLLYFFIGVFLYSCTFGEKARYRDLTEKYNVLEKRVEHVEQETKKNRELIIRVEHKTTNIQSELDKIKERLKKERKQFKFSGIPPASLLEKNTHNGREGSHGVRVSTALKKKALSHNSGEDWESLYHKGVSLFFAGKYRQAEAAFKEFVKHKENKNLYAHALFWLGDVYMHLGELDKAVDMLKRCLEIQPDKPVVRGGKSDAAMYLLGLIYLRKWKDVKSAKFYMTRMKNRFPDSVYLKKLNKLIGERG